MAKAFTPGPETQRDLRNALGRFATGVTVITAPGPVGITANSFASVSLDPPLVLWSPAKVARRCPVFTDDCTNYAIHVMAEHQQAICDAFISDGQAFAGYETSENAHGVPLIHDCAARFECRKHAVHDGGDHWIVVGEVLEAEYSSHAPLLFHAGRYGAFSSGQ